MKERRGEDSDLTTKLTASKLIPLKSSHDFDRNVTSAAAVKYRLGGRQKVRKPEYFTVELCVVLIKEKKKKVVPVTSIVCNRGTADGTIASSGTSSGGGLSGRKRKATPPRPFTFAAKELSITLSAPIKNDEKEERSNNWSS